ncbi:hypothetical protein QBC47DRAFT_268160, partial [Echria macrotheca]
ERERSIDAAFASTFDWVYCDPTEYDKPWDNFDSFLLKDASTYWVTGKPGSGKSTLIKYIAENSSTTEKLNAWAQDHDLFVAQHYFSYRASELQRSEIGMLRSLLHQILQDQPDFIKQGFSERYRVLCSTAGGVSGEFGTEELRTCLRRVIDSRISAFFLFIIDGLDESNTKRKGLPKLVEYINSLGTHRNVKVLISSRPWPEIEESLEGCPRLKVHELTRDDIRYFTESKINNHHRSRTLQLQDPTAINQLVTEIVDSSSGVFLWVALVVQSLLQGLRNHDTISDLFARLQELPKELDDLFRHMWEQVDPRYKAQASRLLQLVKYGTIHGHISVLGISFAEEDEKFATELEVKPLTKETCDYRIGTTRGHLLARCAGLVEV